MKRVVWGLGQIKTPLAKIHNAIRKLGSFCGKNGIVLNSVIFKFHIQGFSLIFGVLEYNDGGVSV